LFCTPVPGHRAQRAQTVADNANVCQQKLQNFMETANEVYFADVYLFDVDVSGGYIRVFPMDNILIPITIKPSRPHSTPQAQEPPTNFQTATSSS
jgi:hypothetical protein